MNWFFLASGAFLIVLAWVEAIWTCIWVDGHAGPLTGRLAGVLQSVFFRIIGKRHRLLSVTGPLILMSAVGLWVVLLWSGFALLFASDPLSVVATHTKTPAGWSELVYFTGYSLATLGNGDFTPQGHWWQMATAAATGSGFLLITLTVTYLLSVLGAVVHQRSLASHILTMGGSAEEVLIRAWDGNEFRKIDLQILSVTEQLTNLSERLATYPMVFYYHAQRRLQSLPVAIAVFGEATLLLSAAVQPAARPAPGLLHSARRSVDALIELAHQGHIAASDDDPPSPRLDILRKAGIPLVSDAEFAAALNREKDLRRSMKGFLNGEHRDWPRGDDSDSSAIA